VIISRRVSGERQVAHRGKRRGAYRVLVKKLKKIDHLENLNLDKRIEEWTV
jgi:hypothetical protein